MRFRLPGKLAAAGGAALSVLALLLAACSPGGQQPTYTGPGAAPSPISPTPVAPFAAPAGTTPTSSGTAPAGTVALSTRATLPGGRDLIFGLSNLDQQLYMVDATTLRPLASIPLNFQPEKMALDIRDGQHIAWITEGPVGKKVHLYDLDRDQFVETLNTNDGPFDVVMFDLSRKAIISNYNAGTVQIFETQSRRVLDTITVGRSPKQIAVRPDGLFAYVTNEGNNTVSVIDLSVNRVVETIGVGRRPGPITLQAQRYLLYVGNQDDNSITVLNAQNFANLGRIELTGPPTDVSVSRDGRFAFATVVTPQTGGAGATMSQATPAASAATPASSASTPAPATSPVGSPAQIQGTPAPTSSPPRQLPSVGTPGIAGPTGAVGTPPSASTPASGGAASATGAAPGQVAIIDTSENRIVGTVAVGADPFSMAPHPTAPELFVANSGSDSISVIDTTARRVTETISGVSRPTFLTLLPTVSPAAQPTAGSAPPAAATSLARPTPAPTP